MKRLSISLFIISMVPLFIFGQKKEVSTQTTPLRDVVGKRESIKPIKNPIELLQNIHGVTYLLKGSTSSQASTGVISESKLDALPQSFDTAGISTSAILALLVETVKEQGRLIDDLYDANLTLRSEAKLIDRDKTIEKNKIAALQAELDSIRASFSKPVINMNFNYDEQTPKSKRHRVPSVN